MKAIPAARIHRPTGQLRVRYGGRDLYFGRADDPASEERYKRWVAELLVRDLDAPLNGIRPQSSVTVNDVLLAYFTHAEQYYRQGDKVSREFIAMRDAAKPVKELYGTTPAVKFGPLALRAVRERLLANGLCRREINKRVNRIRRIVKWAASMEIVPGSVYEALKTVAGLERGRTTARETEPVKPVDAGCVNAVLPNVSPPVAAMIQLQLLTGMRAGEVVIMRPSDIDRSRPIWVYEPSRHKTQYRGKLRQIPLGPQAQEVLTPFLDRPGDQHLFSPVEAEAWRNDQRAVHRSNGRKTKIYPSELRSREKRKIAAKRRRSKRPKRNCYDVDAFRRSVTYGIERTRKLGVWIPHWHPHQLRHAFATRVRKQFGLDGAQVALGHSHADVTQTYAEVNLAKAAEIARQIG